MSIWWDVDKIAGIFSDAAVGYKSWQSALDVICEVTGAAGATIVPIKGTLSPLPVSSNFARPLEVFFQEGWYKNDVRFKGLPVLLRKGYVTDLDFTSQEEIRRNPYYQEWLAPFGLESFAGIRINGGEEDWGLSLQRSKVQGQFSRDEISLLAQLAKGLSSSAALANAIGHARAEAALEGFTASGKAVVMFNRVSEVILANPAAEAIFDGELFVRSRRLVCANRHSQAEFEHVLHSCCSGFDVIQGRPVVINRAKAGPIIAFISTARGVARDIFANCWAYAVLVDPYQRMAPNVNVLMEALGLTRTEAIFACKLSRGGSLRNISDSMHISYETARSHLRNIFAKTGISDQSSLIALLEKLSFPD